MARRVSWLQVPERVRSWVETSLGSDVVEAVTQEGGYSPGAAVRVRLASGRRAFVKALGADIHANSVGMYRQEAATMPHLPADLPVPRLLDVYDDAGWVALVYEDVDGRHPAIPWRPDELGQVAGAIAELSAALDPSPWPDAPSFAEVNANVVEAWRALATAPPPDLDPSVRRMLDGLAEDGVDLAEVVRGEALLHNDIRSDNVLLTPDGRVVFVDWGMPCRGAAWLDLVLFAFTVAFQGGADADLLVRGHPLTRDIAATSIDVVVVAGYAAYARAGQIACAEAALRWVRRRSVGSGAPPTAKAGPSRSLVRSPTPRSPCDSACRAGPGDAPDAPRRCAR
jgi:aminoglycoside phosphotransferase (APT) family kinase protein